MNRMHESFYVPLGDGNTCFPEDALPDKNKGLVSILDPATSHASGAMITESVKAASASLTIISNRINW